MLKYNNRVIIGFGLVLGIIVILIYGYQRFISPVFVVIRFASVSVRAEVAATPQQHRKGLSGRSSLAHNHGMLFVFPDSAVRDFWMKDMQFPLDVLWIDDGEVRSISRQVPRPIHSDYIPRMSSGVPVRYVLEVPAKFAEINGISVGDSVIIEGMPSRLTAGR